MAKMSRSNVKARKWMEFNGYRNIFLFQHTRFSKDYHFEGEEFDGIASHSDRVVLFQVKSNCKITKAKLRKYNELSAVFGIECLWFNAIDRKPLEVNNMPAESFLINEDY